jgi:hypothetical protein
MPRSASDQDRRRGEAYMAKVLDELVRAPTGGRNTALNAAAFTLGRWISARAFEQTVVEDALYAAAERNGLVNDDGQRQCWATIRSGLSAGLQQPIDPDAERRDPLR